MRLNRNWRGFLRRLATIGVMLRRKPFRVGFTHTTVDGSFFRRFYDSVNVSRRWLFLLNMLSGMLIAFSVYFLGQTSLCDRVVDFGLRLLVMVKYLLYQRRLIQAPLFDTFLSLLLIVALTTLICTFIRSLWLITLLNFALAAGVVALSFQEQLPFPAPLSAVPVVLLITFGAYLDYVRQLRFQRRNSKILADRQETGFTILRHITHSVNPTIRTALSPVLAVKEYMVREGMSDSVIARRRDGSDERIGDALDSAVVSISQIGEILETTEDLFAGRIDDRDFTDTDLRELFEQEILPLFAGSRFSIETDFSSVATVQLHRPSFIQAVKNMIRNAEVHGFPKGYAREEGLRVHFAARQTTRDIIIDCGNNGAPFPGGFRTTDFLAFGRKGKNSIGKGLGGAWVAKFVELHQGTFRKIGNDPVRFRITLPRRRTP